jgi:DNA polymerase-3 subunit epsilon
LGGEVTVDEGARNLAVDGGGGSGRGAFAVLDVETTGFDARGVDRIVEVAIVSVRGNGHVDDEFTSLVNPNRDVGPTYIHGITASDVVAAPRFRDIAGDIVDRLCNAVVVGHNVRFDERFVRAEFGRLGAELPAFPTLCTLRLAAQVGVPSGSRRLEACCSAVGVELRDAHCALADAAATAQLLLACLRRPGSMRAPSTGDRHAQCAERSWPSVEPRGRPLPRAQARRARESEVPFLARLVGSLPSESEVSGDDTAYLEALDRVLADRQVTSAEADSVLCIARDYGLSRADALHLHRVYMASICRVALADGVVTDGERRDLELVARLLGLESDVIAAELSRTHQAAPGERRQWEGGLSRQDLVGKSVCFTGSLSSRIRGVPISREDAEAMAKSAGLAVASGVTKTLNFLVVADPNTMSGKAKKARTYGTTILAEAVFWAALGIAVD